MKSLKKLCFVFCALFSFLPSVFAFSDVSNHTPYFDAINYLKDNGIVIGYADGTYKPDNLISRAEFTKIVMGGNMSNASFDCTQKLFNDVSTDSNNWYRDPVCYAFHQGVIMGYGDKTFRPDQNISFVEAAKIIVKANNINTSGATEPWTKEFTDALEKNAAVPYTIGDYTKQITRGEMAEIIYLLKGKKVAGCIEDGGKFNIFATSPTSCCSGLISYFPTYSKGKVIISESGGVCLAPTQGLSEALDIYNTANECTTSLDLGQNVDAKPFKNQNFNGYSFPMESFKDGCAARCDVDLDTKKAKIGWMCTGAL